MGNHPAGILTFAKSGSPYDVVELHRLPFTNYSSFATFVLRRLGGSSLDASFVVHTSCTRPIGLFCSRETGARIGAALPRPTDSLQSIHRTAGCLLAGLRT